MAGPVRESLKQLDVDSWLIGARFILKKTSTAATSGHLWRSVDGSFYSICGAHAPIPPANLLSSDCPFRKVHDAGDAAAAWDLGDAFLKVKLMLDRKGTTAEHTTLEWLAKQKLSFDVPKVLFHSEYEGRKYLIVSRLPGETLNRVWRVLDDDERYQYAKRMVQIVQELCTWRSTKITGIDGKFLADSWLDPRRENWPDLQRGLPCHDYSPGTLQENCQAIGMDCSMFYFCHNDFGPMNLIVDRNKQTIALIDWEMAGYVPKAWPRTKAGASWGLDLEYTAEDYPEYAVREEKEKEWRLLIERTLGEAGFPEVTDVYRSWMYKRLAAERIGSNYVSTNEHNTVPLLIQ